MSYSDNPIRVDVLHEAARLTGGDRNREYGDPAVNLGLAGRLKHLVWRYRNREFSPAEAEALSMILTKIARYVTGEPKRDTCVDMAAYAAILWEVRQVSESADYHSSSFGSTGKDWNEEDIDRDETLKWVEFCADYGAMDPAPDESGGSRE